MGEVIALAAEKCPRDALQYRWLGAGLSRSRLSGTFVVVEIGVERGQSKLILFLLSLKGSIRGNSGV